MSEEYYIGVDVGTGSVRAGLVTRHGHVEHVCVQEISRVSPEPGQYVQSSGEIWSAVVDTVRRVLDQSNVPRDRVRGLGFTGTCSLVINGDDDLGLSAEDPCYDVVMWMDHRAEKEAQMINKTRNKVLDFVGGKVSLEMQMPKLLWLKKNRPDIWKRALSFYDLPDWLVHRATNSESRSLCSLVCKWNYDIDPQTEKVLGWNREYLDEIGLSDLAENDYERIGNVVMSPGQRVSTLSSAAAQELGLSQGTFVGSSLIDAHAGALGMLAGLEDGVGRLGLVSGTSTCHMLLTRSPSLVPGVWGPFWSAVLPGHWLLEAGQSSSGGLLDHVIATHPAHHDVVTLASSRGVSVYQLLEQTLATMTTDHVAMLTRDLHVYPDYHGNRSPLADPGMRGAMVGLTLDTNTVDNLALVYLATVQALCYGTRHIVETLREQGHRVDNVTVCGGLTKSTLFCQTQADVLGLELSIPKEKESVLLGAAMLAMAASDNTDLTKVVSSLTSSNTIMRPSSGPVMQYHEAKYKVFKLMMEDQIKYREIMDCCKN